MTVCDLLQDYDAAVRPSGRTPYNDTRGAVMVTTSLNIRSISAVSEKNMVAAKIQFSSKHFVFLGICCPVSISTGMV